MTREILKIWNRTIFEKKISYAASTWFSRLQQSHGLRHISAIQAQILLLVSGAYKKTSTAALCVLTGIPPLYLTLSKEAKQGQILRLGIPVDEFSPDLYQSKSPKFKFDSSKDFKIERENISSVYDIFTDGSHSDEGTGLAVCIFKRNTQIFKIQVKLSPENSVFQAEIYAIILALQWASTHQTESSKIYTDSLSSLQALDNISSSDVHVQQVQSLLQSTSNVSLHWIRGHTGIHGNERADELAKSAITDSSVCFKFLPFPSSHAKYQLKQQKYHNWQMSWDNGMVGRYTHKLKPKVSESFLLSHRALYLFATNHGPFPQYLHLFNKCPSACCTCGEVGSSIHYATQCPLTVQFHIQRSELLQPSLWFKLLLESTIATSRLIQCITEVERNQYLYHLPPMDVHYRDED